jgi:hypothetical protein
MDTNSYASIDSLWDHHVTPFSPLAKDIEECTGEQIKDLHRSCTILVRNARSLEWYDINKLANLLSLPYKYIFLVQIPVHHNKLAIAIQDQIAFALVRNHDGQVIPGGIATAFTSIYVMNNEQHLEFKVHFTTSSYFHNRSTFTVRMYNSYTNEQLFVSIPTPIFARKYNERSEKLGKRKQTIKMYKMNEQ